MQTIPVHTEINDMHAVTGYQGRTDLPFFHVFSLSHGCESVCAVMPPHRRGFYQVSLLGIASGVSLSVNLQEREAVADLLVFIQPNQVLSWVRTDAQSGFVIYFKPELLGLSEVQLETRFPFFQATEMNIQSVHPVAKVRLWSYCERLCETFTVPGRYRVDILRGLFTAFLFECLTLYSSEQQLPLNPITADALASRFQHLVDRNFLTHRTVSAYARLMKMSPGHLSEVIKKVTGRSASVVITNRVLQEAKLLLVRSELRIVEVSSYLQFSEPTHFTRFFKQASGMTPRQFRDSGRSVRNSG